MLHIGRAAVAAALVFGAEALLEQQVYRVHDLSGLAVAGWPREVVTGGSPLR